MTEKITQDDFAEYGAPSLVYIREVFAYEIEDDARAAGVEFSSPPDAILYAVHAADGERLAVLDDRDAAYMAAREHDLTPVSVH